MCREERVGGGMERERDRRKKNENKKKSKKEVTIHLSPSFPPILARWEGNTLILSSNYKSTIHLQKNK